MIHVYEHPIFDQTGEPIFNFDNDQSDALKKLIRAARTHKPIAVVAGLAVNALHQIYFPSNPDRAAFNMHIEPVNAFFGLLCLTDDGAARPLEDVTHYCSRIQFAMRLRGFHYLFTTHVRLYPQPTSNSKVPPINAISQHGVSARPLRRPQRNKTQDTKAIKRTTRATAKDSDSDYEASEENSIVGTMQLPVVEKKVTDKGWWT